MPTAFKHKVALLLPGPPMTKITFGILVVCDGRCVIVSTSIIFCPTLPFIFVRAFTGDSMAFGGVVTAT